MEVDAETGTEWSREQSAACGCADEGERIEVDLDGPCRRPLVDHDVDAVVFHGGVEVLFHDRREPVDLVDEEHVVRFKRREDARQIARFVEHGPRCDFEAYAQFVGDDVAQRRLAQSRRTVQECMVERFATVFGSLDKDTEVLDDLLLSAEVTEAQRAEGIFEILLGRGQFFLVYIEIFWHIPDLFCSSTAGG